MTWDDYTRAVDRARQRHADRLDLASFEAVDGRIRQRFGERVIVRHTYADGSEWTRYGRVGATTGWKPALMLVGRDSNMGSSDLLGPDDVLLAWQYGREYISAATGKRVTVAELGAAEAR